jgi:hypothetical protein
MLNGNEYSTVGDQVLNTPLLTVPFFSLPELYTQPTPREATAWDQCAPFH